MATKQQRYYEIEDGTAYIYDQPFKHQSVSVSIVPADQLAYYRRTFNLTKIWG